MPRHPIRVLVFGLGPIGRAVSHEIARAPDLRLVGAVDPAPELAGRDLGDLLKVDTFSGIRIAPDADSRAPRKVDVAVHLAHSRFPDALPRAGRPAAARRSRRARTPRRDHV